MRELLSIFLAICPRLFHGNEHHRAWTQHWRQQTTEVLSGVVPQWRKMLTQRMSDLESGSLQWSGSGSAFPSSYRSCSTVGTSSALGLGA